MADVALDRPGDPMQLERRPSHFIVSVDQTLSADGYNTSRISSPAAPMNQPRLLVVDDDEAILGAVRDVAAHCGYEVMTTSAPVNLLNAIQQFDPAIVVLDLSMPESDGVKAMRRLANAQCAAKIVIMSGADSKTLAAAFRLGGEYGLDMAPAFSKPFEPDKLAAYLENAKLGLRRIAPGELVTAMSAGQFEVRYQPKVNLQASVPEIIGSEALVRWNHPRRGLLTANRFIAMAEAEGLIEPLSSWVLAEVISQQSVWERQGKPLVTAVNLPASLLIDLDFPDRVETMLQHACVPRQRLILEITERAAMKEGPTAIDVLTRFRLKDISLSIDDFGVGHSSLVELYRMPFNELKIDASFVRDMPASEEARTIVRTLVRLAHELGLKACAEGVEAAATADMLHSYGCDTAQGFLYGSALTVAEFDALLADHMCSQRWATSSQRSRKDKVDRHDHHSAAAISELAG